MACWSVLGRLNSWKVFALDEAFRVVELLPSTAAEGSAGFFSAVRGFLGSDELGACILRFFDDVDSEPSAGDMVVVVVMMMMMVALVVGDVARRKTRRKKNLEKFLRSLLAHTAGVTLTI